jgi:hypothetical protein
LCHSSAEKHTGTRAARFAALILCVVFTAAMLLSASFILTRAEHVHDNDGADGACLTCAHVASAAKLLGGASGIIVKAAAASACVFAIALTTAVCAFCVRKPSLIELKVKITA